LKQADLVEIQETRKLLDKLTVNGTGMLVVVGLPAYNEEKTIPKIILKAQKYVHIVIVCDDGTSDLTGEIASRLGAVVVRHEKNFGHGGRQMPCQNKLSKY
jgi:hypothetical protein